MSSAALLKGCILWQLAINHMSFEEVVEGPSQRAMGSNFAVKSSMDPALAPWLQGWLKSRSEETLDESNWTMSDNELTSTEKMSICGTIKPLQ